MTIWRSALAFILLMLPVSAWSIDSYRFLHVTIDTPWLIFVFLFFLVFAPMILMAILYWRNALKSDDDEAGEKHD